MSLTDKVIIISGGSRGIGKAIALKLAENGAEVLFTYHNNETAAREVIEIGKKFSYKIEGFKVDIREQEQVKDFIKDIIASKKKIDVVINNAGIRKDKTLLFLSKDDWHDVIASNLDGTFYLTQAALFHMLKKKNGRIIIVSSISGISGIAGQTNYASSKAALLGFTRALAKEVASYGVTVNAIAPGGIKTDMVNSMNDNKMQKLIQDVPMGRLGTCEEIAKVAHFLADTELSPDYLTGSTIVVDGGLGS